MLTHCIKTRTKRHDLFWLIYIASALLFMQNSGLHLHGGHHHSGAESQHPVFNDHQHLPNICAANCGGLDDHGRSIEVDITPEGVVKKDLFWSLGIIVLLTLGMAVFHQRRYRSVIWCYINEELARLVVITLRPPPRAPPS